MAITPFGKKVIKSGAWVFSARVVQRVLFFARTVILARLLSPNDFGLFGIALLALSMLDTFSRTGFRQALIQKKENINSYLNTAWTAGVIRGLLIAIVLFASAPYVALFFGASQVRSIVQIIGLAIIFHGLTNIAVVYFEKELEFHKYFTYQLAGIVVEVTVAITAAFILRSAWALVLGRLAGDLTRCVTSYIIDPYRPRFQLDLSKIRELFGFGKWILGSGILAFLILQGDDMFVGKLLGVTALGFYQMAYFISNLPATEITHVISQVTFPAYSKMQDDIPGLRDIYQKVLNVTTFLSFPATGLIFMLAPDFTRIFLGEKWMPMVPAIQVLVWWGGIRSIGGVNGALLRAVKRPDVVTKFDGLRLLILVILIYPLTIKLGIVGASLAVLISSLFTTPATFYVVVHKVLKHRISLVFRETIVPFISTIAMCLLLAIFMPDKLSLTGFISVGLIGVAGCFSFVYVFDKILGHNSWHNLNITLSGLLKR